jgi:DNA helicase HerA-like ATPase
LNRLDHPELFDRELGGYLLVTYRISDLSPDILSASEAVIVTRVDDRRQALALLALRHAVGHRRKGWRFWLISRSTTRSCYPAPLNQAIRSSDSALLHA